MNPALETRLDTPTLGAFERDLEYVENRELNRMLPDYKAANLVPVEVLNEPWAETSSFRLLDGVGSMELMGSRTTNLPFVDVVGEEFVNRAYRYITGYELNADEIIATVRRGIPIEARKIQLVNQVYVEHQNKMILFGDRRVNSPGFINHPAWPRMVAPFRLDSSSTTNQQLATLNAGASAIDKITNNNSKIRPDTLLLPKRRYDYAVSQSRLNDAAPVNILKFFLDNNSSIKNVDWLTELEGAGPGGEDVAIFYRRDPMCFKARILDSFKPRPLFQRTPFDAYRAYSYKWNGLIVYVRASALIMIGV